MLRLVRAALQILPRLGRLVGIDRRDSWMPGKLEVSSWYSRVPLVEQSVLMDVVVRSQLAD